MQNVCAENLIFSALNPPSPSMADCFSPRLAGNMRGVVRGLHDVKRRPISQLLADGSEQCQISRPVTSSLKKEHWHFDLEQIVGPSDICSSQNMQAKSKKDNTWTWGKPDWATSRDVMRPPLDLPLPEAGVRGRFRGRDNR